MILAAALASSWLGADVVTLNPDRDNTLIEDAGGTLSLGKAYNFFAGRVDDQNGGGLRRRGLLRFDVGAAVPAGSTITNVSLKLRMVQSSAGTQTVRLRRLLADWGEGDSFAFGGSGAPAEPGDATWLHRFYPDVFWPVAGGQFAPSDSASTNVGGVGFYTWNSTVAMVADVTGWLNAPASNFGWLVLGNESTVQTVKKFEARESEVAAYRPLLTITYTPPPPCVDADLNCDGMVDGEDLGLLLADWGDCARCAADLNGDGKVDGGDLGSLLSQWS